MNSIISWFAHNPIAAILVMIMIILGGLSSIPNTSKEFFPSAPLNEIEIQVPYLGAGPLEVEEQISIRIEDAIHDLDGIKKLSSFARLGGSETRIEIESDYDVQKLLGDIKSRVDALDTLPNEAENPRVFQRTGKYPVLSLALSGDVPEKVLKRYGQEIRDEIAKLDSVNNVELGAARAYEIAIDVSEFKLKQYQLSFDELAAAIRSASINLPAGNIRTDQGDIQIQTRGQAYSKADFENLLVRSNPDGSRILLGDIATIDDGFASANFASRFNGKPSIAIDVKSTSKPDVVKISNAIKDYVANKHLPSSLELVIWRDSSNAFRGRVSTLITNGIGGLVLVFFVLMLFLRPLLAWWVAFGIGIAFLGALWLLPLTGISLNMISLFAFLLVLGIVVDDAIIVGESVYSAQQQGHQGLHSLVRAEHQVSRPILYAVISTMIVFIPMFFLPGDSAHSAKSIPTVVILCLVFSLIECLCILPSHLANMRPETPATSALGMRFQKLQHRSAKAMETTAEKFYKPILYRSLKAHWLSMAIFWGALILTIAVFAGGWIRTSFLPEVTSDYIRATATIRSGSSYQDNQAVLEQIEQAGLRLQQKLVQDDSKESLISNVQAHTWGDTVLGVVEINRDYRDQVSSSDIKRQWQEIIGELPPQVEDISLSHTINDSGKALQFVLSSPDNEALNQANLALKTRLASYPYLYHISDSMEHPRSEIQLSLKPEGSNAGISLAHLASQIRSGFYGQEIQRIPRDGEDIRVMLRYEKAIRDSVDQFDSIYIRDQAGNTLPFHQIAEITFKPSYVEIERVNRERILTVTADAIKDKADTNAITDDLLKNFFPQLEAQFPRLDISLEGEQKERKEFFIAMLIGFAKALLAIYIIMAIAFKSYWQPIIILTAVPFGFMGAVIGHLIIGKALSIFSFLGILACAGVVVNDNLVLIDRINQLKAQGINTFEALMQSGRDRFRPIILTSLTTFIGLVPIMLETSLQAQFLIPMVISLAFGVALATPVTLLLVPCLYLAGSRKSNKRG